MLYIDPIAQRAWSPSEIELNSPAREKLALKELEQLFIMMLMKEMRKTVPENEGFFESSSELKIYREMMDEVISEKMAEAGQLGLAKMMAEQLRVQELVDAVDPSLERGPIPLKNEASFIGLGSVESKAIPLEKRGSEPDFVPFSGRRPFAL